MVLGQAESVGAGWRQVGAYLDRVRGITAADVQRVAKRYLTPDTRTVGVLMPLPPQGAAEAPPDAGGRP
jgi:zinc protease